MAGSCVLGIDPGAQGAIAVFSAEGQLLEVHDMPWTEEPNGRKITNAKLLAGIVFRSHAGRIFCEFVASRPTDGVIQAFSFGRCRGVIEGVAGAHDVRVDFLTPPVWKRFAGVPPGKDHKDVARTRAIARWPAHADLFARKCDIDRAEACLIGDCGLQRMLASA